MQDRDPAQGEPWSGCVALAPKAKLVGQSWALSIQPRPFYPEPLHSTVGPAYNPAPALGVTITFPEMTKSASTLSKDTKELYQLFFPLSSLQAPLVNGEPETQRILVSTPAGLHFPPASP